MPDEVARALENIDSVDASQAEALRFPLSMAEPRMDLDRQGGRCTTVDCTLNIDVLRQAQGVRALKAFLIELALGWVGQKHKMQLDPKFKLPKMKYKGETVQVVTEFGNAKTSAGFPS